jgi:hypothetical protein
MNQPQQYAYDYQLAQFYYNKIKNEISLNKIKIKYPVMYLSCIV